MWITVCFSEKKEKKYLFLATKKQLIFLCCIITHRGATLSLFHEEVKEERNLFTDRLMMLDARVKLRQKAQLAELCSRWVGKI